MQATDYETAIAKNISMASIKAFAARRGYSYSHRVLDSTIFNFPYCSHTHKVMAVKEALLSLPIDDWLLYFDASVYSTRAGCRQPELFERLMPNYATDGMLMP